MKAAVLIDGGYLRVITRKHAHHDYTPDYIERIATAAATDDETLLRILYYDCAPFDGVVKLPVSGREKSFDQSARWLDELAAKDLFAVRRGVLKLRGFVPKRIPIASNALSDDWFKPQFEQKGVDMRIGLDIATFSTSRAVDRLILITNDTDCVPAMKAGRIAGLQIVLIKLAGESLAKELTHHSDYTREMAWPS